MSIQEQNYDLSLCENVVKNTKAKMYNKENIDVLIKILDKKNKLKKGEFETSDEFILRKNKALDNIKKQIKTKTGTEYILYEHIPESEYDADTKQFAIKKPSAGYLEYDENYKCYDSYVAENTFGAQVEVEVCNVQNNVVSLSSLQGSKIKSIIVEKNNAKNLKDNIRLIIVADINETESNIDTYNDPARYSYPYERNVKHSFIKLHPVTACYYDKKTKEVYSLY